MWDLTDRLQSYHYKYVQRIKGKEDLMTMLHQIENTKKNGSHKKEANGNSGVENYSNQNEKFTRELI